MSHASTFPLYFFTLFMTKLNMAQSVNIGIPTLIYIDTLVLISINKEVWSITDIFEKIPGRVTLFYNTFKFINHLKTVMIFTYRTVTISIGKRLTWRTTKNTIESSFYTFEISDILTIDQI